MTEWHIFKRGMAGVYHHCGEQHLQRYLDEFAFRYSKRMKLGVDDRLRAELRSRASRASVSPIGEPVKAKTPKQLARAFLKWTRRRT